MTRYLGIVGGILGFLLAGFLVAEAFELPVLSAPGSALAQGGATAAILAVALLIADAVLPVPSSVVMVAAGALYGPMLGTLLSLTGQVVIALPASPSAPRRAAPGPADPGGRAGAGRPTPQPLGATTVVVSRPVPLLAETVVILAGASPLGWGCDPLRARRIGHRRPSCTPCRAPRLGAWSTRRSCGRRRWS